MIEISSSAKINLGMGTQSAWAWKIGGQRVMSSNRVVVGRTY